jgi:hypothetical protein
VQSDPVLVVAPSMTFDGAELAKIPGAIHFGERMLWLLQTLRNLRGRVVYVTSEALPERSSRVQRFAYRHGRRPSASPTRQLRRPGAGSADVQAVAAGRIYKSTFAN